MKITVTNFVIENKKSCGYEKMRTVCRENSCTGCMACIGKCKKNAITIKDSMVAYNAVIDEDKCVNCGMCEKVCPNNQAAEKRKPIDWKEGWAPENIRGRASSGGAASAMMKYFVENGGYVAYGSDSSESVSQVIIALSTYGIDCNEDERFIKNKRFLLKG